MRTVRLVVGLLLLASPLLAGPPGWRFEGQVTDEEGRPLQGVTVRAYRDESQDCFLPGADDAAAIATTDADGRYALELAEGDTPSRNVVVVAETPGVVRREVWIEGEALDAGPSFQIHPVALWLDEHPRVERDESPLTTLRVLLRRGGAPARDLRVHGLAADHAVGEAAVSSPEGRCPLLLPGGATHVRVTGGPERLSKDEPSWSFTTPRGEADELVVQLPRFDATVSGAVAYASEPEEGDRRLSARLSFVSDDGALEVAQLLPATGRFSLRVPAGSRGTLRLSPWSEGWAGACGGGLSAVDVVRRVEAWQEDVRLAVPLATVRVQVLGPTGLPRGRVRVDLGLPDGRILSDLTSHRGTIALRAVPAGLLRVTARDGPVRGDTTVVVAPGAEVRATVSTP